MEHGLGTMFKFEERLLFEGDEPATSSSQSNNGQRSGASLRRVACSSTHNKSIIGSLCYGKIRHQHLPISQPSPTQIQGSTCEAESVAFTKPARGQDTIQTTSTFSTIRHGLLGDWKTPKKR